MDVVTAHGFAAFTAVTGNISALESQNYALLEAYISEVDERRLDSALFRMHADAKQLVVSGKTLQVLAQGIPELLDILVTIQEALNDWKRLHVAAMIRVLGPSRVDHSAVAYLKGSISQKPNSANRMKG